MGKLGRIRLFTRTDPDPLTGRLLRVLRAGVPEHGVDVDYVRV